MPVVSVFNIDNQNIKDSTARSAAQAAQQSATQASSTASQAATKAEQAQSAAEAAQSAAETAQTAAEQAQSQVEEILNLSRLESATSPAPKQSSLPRPIMSRLHKEVIFNA